MSEKIEYIHPEISPETKPFWEAANEDRLLVATCTDCGRGHHFPRAVCPHCHSTNLEWKEADGRGTIYSVSVISPGKDAPRYALAYVEIADRVKAMTNIVDCDMDELHIGQKVKAVFKPSRSGQKILLFTPDN
ncbi:MAG: Zn-ribbon domain-containing OB-fold protein [Mesorhizobium sp.]